MGKNLLIEEELKGEINSLILEELTQNIFWIIWKTKIY